MKTLSFGKAKSNYIYEIYSSRAKIYDFLLFITGHKLAINYFIKRLPFDTDAPIRVLDAGCGTGLYTLSLLKRFPNATVTAFDFNEQMLEIFQGHLDRRGMKGRVEMFVADITKPLPVRGEKFDLIITGGVLEYVDIKKAVNNLSRYVKDCGYFINVAVKKGVLGEFIVGKFWKLKPYSTEENIQVFVNNDFSLCKSLEYPFTKEAHLFRR